MKTLLTVIGWALTAYVLYCALLFFAQRRLIFPRHLTHTAGPASLNPGVEKLQIPITQGHAEAWFLTPSPVESGRQAPAIIFAHGNAEVIDDLPGEFEWISKLGVGVLLVEFPGYGRSGGNPTQATITETFVSAYDMLVRRKDVDSNRIVLMGRSIGAGAVCALAEKRSSAAMVLISPFTGTRVFAAAYFAPGFLVLDPFDNISVIRKYPNPVLVFHGEFDRVIPFSHGKALAEAAPKGTLVSYVCGHNDLPPDPVRYRRDLSGFLADMGILPRATETDDGPMVPGR